MANFIIKEQAKSRDKLKQFTGIPHLSSLSNALGAILYPLQLL